MGYKDTLAATMKNSNAVFLASNVNENFVTEQNNVIEIAKECGVEHIVKLSSPGADKKAANFISRPNGMIEDMLKTSGIKFTILQPNAFMQNWLGHFSETVKKERKIYEATGDGRKPFIDARDIAEVAFIVLVDPKAHYNKTYLLTGGIAVSYGQVAEAISKAIEDKVTYIAMSHDDAKKRMEQKGMPTGIVNTLLAIADGQRSGQADFVNNMVEEILGKKPITIEKFAKDYYKSFK